MTPFRISVCPAGPQYTISKTQPRILWREWDRARSGQRVILTAMVRCACARAGAGHRSWWHPRDLHARKGARNAARACEADVRVL
jgi:hypothetical protein